MLNSLLYGFWLSLTLIVAIGAQNAFVLKQGLKREYIFAVCLLCATSDTILILIGVFGFAQMMQLHPEVLRWIKYVAAGFLALYALQHFYQAYRLKQVLLESQLNQSSLWRVVSLCLMLTWLNPHVYLDTVVLIGAVSLHFATYQFYFALGAILASWLFFFSLGYAAHFLSPIFKDYRAWKVLDVLMGFLLAGIAVSLLL